MSDDGRSSILASSAVMAAGTTVSRLSGFVRSALLVAALGGGLHAELFNIANTVPNMLYILLAGGVFNAVLVPQLVRSMKQDADGGEAYVNRVVTVAGLFLAVVTVLLVVAAPWVMQLFLSGAYDEPRLAEQRQSVVDFARFCLPQVFFYGMFVLVGQILNARGRFGPMMWAPIANNLIAVSVLATYLLVFGPASGSELFGPFSPGQELLLGLGSTLGIVAQLLVLLPVLRKAGLRFRPRLDLRGTGLGHTLRLGVWTVLFVIVNQIAYTVVVNLASSGPAQAPGEPSTGYTVYSFAFLIVMVPHSIITVSLATAALPRLSALAADGDLPGLARTLTSTLRSALAVIVPFALLLPLVARDTAHVIWGYGAGADTYQNFAPTLALFGIGLVFFTVHYLMLRGFYALERTRTVFLVQCVIALVNVVAAVLLVREATVEQTSPALVLAYAAAYLVGAGVSSAVLARHLGGLGFGPLVRFVLRLVVVAGVATAGAALMTRLLAGLGEDPSLPVALARASAVALVDVVLFVGLATVVPAHGGHRRARHRGAAAPLPLPTLTHPTIGTIGDDPRPRGRTVQHSAGPGDVLADRYLLVDLLTESGNGRFWRAHDQVLERHVALHCLAEDDERAGPLNEAARLSATVHDRRLLRVLDADRRDGIAYVVNEWGSGTSLDILVGSEGPLPPRRAAWIVSEVAEAMAVAHEQRVAHGRLVPENVLIDQTGQVRIIGFCVDAALLGIPTGQLAGDVADLGGLLYFLLTARWAGPSASDTPAALRDHERLLRPRQVRAGIPRTLDTICDQVLNPYDTEEPGQSGVNLHTARGLAVALAEYVGDPTGLIQPAPVGGIAGAGVLAVPERRTHSRPEPETPPEPGPPPGPSSAETTSVVPAVPEAAPVPEETVAFAVPPSVAPEHRARPSPMPSRRSTSPPSAYPRRRSTSRRRPGCRSSTTRRTTCRGWRSGASRPRRPRRSRTRPSAPSSPPPRPTAPPPDRPGPVPLHRPRVSTGPGTTPAPGPAAVSSP